MSYILNALRKSEQERHNSQTETLENRIEVKPGLVQKRTSTWIIALVIVNLFFLSYFIWSFSKVDIEESHNKADIPKAIEEVKIAAKATINSKLVSSPAAIIETAKDVQQHSIAETIKTSKSKTQDNPKINKPELKQAIQVIKQKSKAIEITQTLSKADKVSAKVDATEKQQEIPFLSTLDYSFRRTVPVLDINVYVYAEKKQDRFIMLEMTKYFSGQEISSGMTLKEIRINSLVVEYKNRSFQIKRK